MKYLDNVVYNNETLQIRDVVARDQIEQTGEQLAQTQIGLQTAQTDITVLKSEMHDVQNDIESLETRVETCETDIGVLQTEMSNISPRVSTIENTVETQGETIATHTEQIAKINSDINTINANVAGNTTGIEQLSHAVDVITTIDAQQTEAISELRQGQTKIGEHLDTIDGQIVDLDDRITASTYEAGTGIYFGQGPNHTNINVEDELIDQINSNTRRLDEIDTEFDNINNTLADHEQRITTNENNITTLQNTKTSLEGYSDVKLWDNLDIGNVGTPSDYLYAKDQNIIITGTSDSTGTPTLANTTAELDDIFTFIFNLGYLGTQWIPEVAKLVKIYIYMGGIGAEYHQEARLLNCTSAFKTNENYKFRVVEFLGGAWYYHDDTDRTLYRYTIKWDQTNGYTLSVEEFGAKKPETFWLEQDSSNNLSMTAAEQTRLQTFINDHRIQDSTGGYTLDTDIQFVAKYGTKEIKYNINVMDIASNSAKFTMFISNADPKGDTNVIISSLDYKSFQIVVNSSAVTLTQYLKKNPIDVLTITRDAQDGFSFTYQTLADNIINNIVKNSGVQAGIKYFWRPLAIQIIDEKYQIDHMVFYPERYLIDGNNIIIKVSVSDISEGSILNDIGSIIFTIDTSNNNALTGTIYYNTIQNDVAQLQTDVGTLQTDMTKAKTDITNLQTRSYYAIGNISDPSLSNADATKIANKIKASTNALDYIYIIYRRLVASTYETNIVDTTVKLTARQVLSSPASNDIMVLIPVYELGYVLKMTLTGSTASGYTASFEKIQTQIFNIDFDASNNSYSISRAEGTRLADYILTSRSYESTTETYKLENKMAFMINSDKILRYPIDINIGSNAARISLITSITSDEITCVIISITITTAGLPVVSVTSQTVKKSDWAQYAHFLNSLSSPTDLDQLLYGNQNVYDLLSSHTYTGLPSDITSYTDGQLYLEVDSNTQTTLQRLFDTTNGAIYIRRYYNNSWSSWYKFAGTVVT